MRALRSNVRLERNSDEVTLVDDASGFILALPPLARATLDALSTGAIDDVTGADLCEMLSSVGLLEEGLSHEAIEARQRRARAASRDEERLHDVREAVRRACAKVPLYRDRFAQVDVDGIIDWADYSQVPETSKKDIRRGFPEQVLADDVNIDALLASRAAFLNATSGSSEDRLEVISDARVPVLPLDYFTFFGVERECEVTRAAVLTSPICAGFECHLGLATMEERTRGTMLTLNSTDDVLAITDDEVDAILDEIVRFAPTALFVNPWYASALVVAARRRGKEIPQIPLVFSTYQLLTARQRRLLAEAFSARVFSIYSATELGGFVAGTECRLGRTHVREDHVHVDIAPLDEVLADGFEKGVGRVLVTTLKNHIMPLVRYSVGDLARIGDPCGCEMGEEWPTLELHGRAPDFLIAPDGRRLSLARVDEALGEEAPIFYRVIQDDRAHFRIETVDDDVESHARALAILRTLLGENAEVTGERVAHIAPERSLKYRQIVVSREVLST